MTSLVDLIVFCLAAITALMACAFLALSQPRHWRAITGANHAPKSLRLAGWGSAALSLVFCILRDGGSFAALLWPLLLASGALTIAMALTYRPAWLKIFVWRFSD
ncbi:MAG: DUF3325 domain-containing protein [Pseudomonadota bacterium]